MEAIDKIEMAYMYFIGKMGILSADVEHGGSQAFGLYHLVNYISCKVRRTNHLDLLDRHNRTIAQILKRFSNMRQRSMAQNHREATIVNSTFGDVLVGSWPSTPKLAVLLDILRHISPGPEMVKERSRTQKCLAALTLNKPSSSSSSSMLRRARASTTFMIKQLYFRVTPLRGVPVHISVAPNPFWAKNWRNLHCFERDGASPCDDVG
ncbi:hypothetical protein F4818DRAFT_442524 [Hypoxylon cercidicola]|nr:hypothetical protein F4818DRAFT_442524 [Hypoxylon cercidicola]